MPRLLQNNTVEITSKPTDNADQAWESFMGSLEEYQKSYHTTTVGHCQINLEDKDGLVIIPGANGGGLLNFPFNSQGKASLLDFLGLDGLYASFKQVTVGDSDVDKKQAVIDAKNVLWDAILYAKRDLPIRFHTVSDNHSQQVVQYVSSPRFGVMSETDLAQNILDAAKLFGYRPRRITIANDSFTMQLIQNPDTLARPDLTQQHGPDGHVWRGATDGKGGNILGLIQLTFSETAKTNVIQLGTYQTICDNGAVFGESEDLNFGLRNGTKMATPVILKAMFETCEKVGLDRADLLNQSANIPWGHATLALLEKTVENPKYSCKFTFKNELKDRLVAMIGEGASLSDAVNYITAVAARAGIPAQDRLKLERIGGELVVMATKGQLVAVGANVAEPIAAVVSEEDKPKGKGKAKK